MTKAIVAIAMIIAISTISTTSRPRKTIYINYYLYLDRSLGSTHSISTIYYIGNIKYYRTLLRLNPLLNPYLAQDPKAASLCAGTP